MHYQFHAQTDPGRVRSNNEDAVMFDESVGLAVLADGMGGYNAGEVASGIATAYLQEHFAAWLATEGSAASGRAMRQAMRRHVRAANETIMAVAEQQPECQGMGTTLVFGVFQPERIVIGSIGDSRCYRWRAGELLQLSHDHSVLQEQIDAGLVDPRDAHKASNRNLVTRALGFANSGELDVFEHVPESGDLYLLCSDGLSDMLQDEDIAGLLDIRASLETCASSLIRAANSAGGRDNVSVLLISSAGAPIERKRPFFRWRGA
ncbi:Stp1/IreP family PP2C-type Ser/Thr phosphatase [Xylophilus rhododendri]|uniref:Stp1/IreP family PP2C-type Ser/Thr phosphatase n=1 Tax=Xylophilus rhododendri TaxID=2697032 RepID=A0A857J889_9BURK|nr:Stp1/IreP family PP2C-type Ser/Thr phosphatase [Xylophilus rhododendri]QHI98988.1 Stp1/IreP family PP2C-type Ser/Thr phosphatase [Xylophilus rhododendri]